LNEAQQRYTEKRQAKEGEMNYKSLILKTEDGIAYITINRPEALNALNTDVLADLTNVFNWVNDSDDVKIAILTGAGRSFVAGADIAQMEKLTVQEGRDMTLKGQRVMNLIEQIDKMVICAINGFALGGGCELAMACDIRIASDKAKFGQPEVNLGIIPGFGGTQRLPRLVGTGMAKYLIATGEMISADEACRIGLVEKVVPADDLLAEATKIAKTIISKAPIGIKMAKHSINVGMKMDVTNGVAYEAEAYVSTFASEDRVEGMNAFVEKRPANFKNK
jgi:enoyl-CoA hydratase